MSRATGNLPESVTTFIGRRREIDAIRRRMQEARIVTLVGAAGLGKTRLALQVAAEARRAFPDGVWMVDLASLDDASRLAQATASALGIRDQSARAAEEKLLEHLEERRALIVLDNCEHVLDAAAALVAHLLRDTPNLRVLATSREGLGIHGEHLYAVSSLSTPNPNFPPEVTALAQYESVSLLVDRARSVRPDFAVTEQNRLGIAQLCVQLDGMPLAIELAATRLRSLGLSEIVARLDDRFGFLTGGSRDAEPRQQTLRALVDWSYGLCTAEEQRLWARLSVFAGSFDLEAVEAVCDGDVDVLDHLVAKSIVLAEPAGDSVRYRLLVTMREYGAELLQDGDGLRRRHFEHYLRRAVTMVQTWCGPGQSTGLERMREDHANVRAALQRADDAESAARMASALRFHWIVGGFLGEGRRSLEQALERASAATPERGSALWVLAWVALVQGDHQAGHARVQQCAALAEDLGDDALAAHAAHWTGLAHMFDGDLPTAVELFDRAVAGHERAGNTNSALVATFQRVVALAYDGDIERARETCDAALAICDRHGERWNRAYLLWTRGILLWRSGEPYAAEVATRAALEEQRAFLDGINVALSIELLGWIAAERSDHAAGARLLGAAHAVWTQFGTAMSSFGPDLTADSVAATTACREALGERRHAELRSGPERLDIVHAIDVALGAEPDTAPAEDDQPLSPREREVAALIAEGMTNKAIAEALILSRRTIDGHVERIFGKLGFSSRAQVAAWVAERAPMG